jgi:hypothetical protein
MTQQHQITTFPTTSDAKIQDKKFCPECKSEISPRPLTAEHNYLGNFCHISCRHLNWTRKELSNEKAARSAIENLHVQSMLRFAYEFSNND